MALRAARGPNMTDRLRDRTIQDFGRQHNTYSNSGRFYVSTHRPDLKEDLAHLFGYVKRHIYSIVSAGAPLFSV
jgi:hypothetical protein